MSVAADAALAEYRELKAEQRDRMGLRDNLVYAGLAAQATALALVVSGKAGPPLLLLLPPVAFVLGWTRLANDSKVRAIRWYIRTELAARLAACAESDRPVLFGWESAVVDPRHTVRRWGQLLADLLAFALLPEAAVVWLAAGPPLPIGLGIAAGAVGVLPALLAVETIRHAAAYPHAR